MVLGVSNVRLEQVNLMVHLYDSCQENRDISNFQTKIQALTIYSVSYLIPLVNK